MIEVKKICIDPIEDRANNRHYHRMKIKELRDGFEELVTKVLIKSNGIKSMFKLKSEEYALLQELLEYADKAANYCEVLGADRDRAMTALTDMHKELADSKARQKEIIAMLEEIRAKQNKKEEKKA